MDAPVLRDNHKSVGAAKSMAVKDMKGTKDSKYSDTGITLPVSTQWMKCVFGSPITSLSIGWWKRVSHGNRKPSTADISMVWEAVLWSLANLLRQTTLNYLVCIGSGVLTASVESGNGLRRRVALLGYISLAQLVNLLAMFYTVCSELWGDNLQRSTKKTSLSEQCVQ